MAKKLSKEKPLTKQQKKFVRNYVETGKVSESALRAGYVDQHYGSYLKAQPKVQSAIQKALDDAGLDDINLAKKLKEGTEAWYVKKEGGEEYPDYHAQAKFTDMAIKIKGGYAPEKHEIEHKQIVLNFDSNTVAGLLDAKAISPLEAKAVVKELSREPLED